MRPRQATGEGARNLYIEKVSTCTVLTATRQVPCRTCMTMRLAFIQLRAAFTKSSPFAQVVSRLQPIYCPTLNSADQLSVNSYTHQHRKVGEYLE